MKQNYFKLTQPNPTEKLGNAKKGDCAVRALSIVESLTWIEAFDILVDSARKSYSMPNDMENILSVLHERGFIAHSCRVAKGEKRMTVEQFAEEHPFGRYILRCARHLTAVVDGVIRDSWDTSSKCVYRYFEAP